MSDDRARLLAEQGSTPRVILYGSNEPKTDSADRWWVRPKPKQTHEEARAGLSAYGDLLAAMDAAAREEEEARRRAAEVADRAEFAMLERIAADYLAGHLSQVDLADLYHCFREVSRSGHNERWDHVVPFHSADIIGCKFNAPNADGRWSGTWPFKYGQSVPADGQSVVYWLVDEDGVDCYIGSTRNLRKRLKWHQKDGKAFVSWRAAPHPSRTAAYAAEHRLLRERMPYLNQRCGR